MTSHRIPRAPRFEVRDLRAVADSGREFFSTAVADLSATGCLLLTDRPCAVGDTLTLIFQSLDQRLPLEIVARVVRVDEGSVAVEFDGMSTEQIERLHSYLVAHGTKL